MTEKEWLEDASDPTHTTRMVGQLRFASDRKLRLLGCALCREVWSELPSLGQQALEIGEQCADNLVPQQTLLTYAKRIKRIYPPMQSEFHAIQMAAFAVSECGWYAAELTVGSGLVPFRKEGELIHDIFGNPFRPVSLDPIWWTRTVIALATVAYTERNLSSGRLDRDRIAVLADALVLLRYALSG